MEIDDKKMRAVMNSEAVRAMKATRIEVKVWFVHPTSGNDPLWIRMEIDPTENAGNILAENIIDQAREEIVRKVAEGIRK